MKIMRIKIETEVSGNEFFDLLRKVPKDVAIKLHGSASVNVAVSEKDEAAFWHSVDKIIEAKRR